MKAEIRYLFNSGFTLKTETHFFIFDYYLDTPKGGTLDDGVINPHEIEDLDVVSFASHAHYDHYNPVILDWKKQIPKIRYILSNDIESTENAIMVSPGETLDLGDFTLQTLKSTDLGCAFLVKADGLCIYHAGDLNWWHWNGETKTYNDTMAQRYKEQIDFLKGEHIDVAFVPLDPRLEDKYLLGIDYFMRNIGAELAIPMHFGNNFSSLEAFQKDQRADAYRHQVAILNRRGEKAILN